MGITLTAPIQSLQQANNKDILSRLSIFQFFSPTSQSQPSGINPSKNGNNILLWYAFSESGSVRLMASAFSDARKAVSYRKVKPFSSSVSTPAFWSCKKISACFIIHLFQKD